MEDDCQRFAFVHVPKTGGTTITELWQNSSNAASKLMQHLRHSWHGLTSLSHETAQSMRWHVGGGAQWERTFTFAVVRNPYDLMLSQFFYHVDEHCGHVKQTIHELPCQAIDFAKARGVHNHSDPRYQVAFAEFVRLLDSQRFRSVGLLSKLAARDGKPTSQRAWLSDQNGTNVIVSHVVVLGSPQYKKLATCRGLLGQVCGAHSIRSSASASAGTDSNTSAVADAGTGSAAADYLASCDELDRDRSRMFDIFSRLKERQEQQGAHSFDTHLYAKRLRMSRQSHPRSHFYTATICDIVRRNFREDFEAFGFDASQCP